MYQSVKRTLLFFLIKPIVLWRCRKRKFALLVLFRDYANSFNLYNVAELSSNRKGGNGIQVETENENCTVGKEMYQNL